MNFQSIAKFSLLTVTALFANQSTLPAQAQSISPGNLGIGNGGLPSNLNRIETPINSGAIEPLGSQQFFRDKLNTLNEPSPPPENPLKINTDNLVPTEIPSDRLLNGDKSPASPNP
jgi:hypothetical protein